MAGGKDTVDVSGASGSLIAVEGVHADGLVSTARTVSEERTSTGALSFWDASGIFAELAVAEESAGQPSARTLLLLYASDLAYRLRSEVLPILALGRDVVVAPYVETPLAFARVAGVHSEWIADVFAFAPKPDLRYYAAAQPGGLSERQGFVEFAGRRLLAGREVEKFISETDRHLRGLARLAGGIRL